MHHRNHAGELQSDGHREDAPDAALLPQLRLQSRQTVNVVNGSPLQELIAMQQNGPKEIGFFGTRNMGWMHQQLIEVLSYAMVLTVSPPLTLLCDEGC